MIVRHDTFSIYYKQLFKQNILQLCLIKKFYLSGTEFLVLWHIKNTHSSTMYYPVFKRVCINKAFNHHHLQYILNTIYHTINYLNMSI